MTEPLTDEEDDVVTTDCPPILVRGAPGSGKTTFAKATYPRHVLIEADDYFTVDGRYLFDHSKLSDAHKRCLFLTQQAVSAGLQVVVANTFSRYWEIKPYLQMYPNARVYRCTGEWQNVHNVPVETVERIRDRMEPIQDEIFVP